MNNADVEMDDYISRQYAATSRVFADPVLTTVHSTTAPQQTYVELAATSAVRDLGGGVYALFRMDDIRYLNHHPAVEQGFKYLGSNRPAIPLGLDGDIHKKYRRLLNPVFAPPQVAATHPTERFPTNCGCSFHAGIHQPISWTR